MKISDALEIEVTNFGPIVEANVDLRPFTLFVGPSNTGKSYLAIMIYALHRLFGGSATRRPSWRHSAFERYPPHVWRSPRKERILSSSKGLGELTEWVHGLFNEERPARGQRRLWYAMPESVAALVRPLFDTEGVSDEIARDEISRCFGLQSPGQLVRSPGTTAAQVSLRRYVGTKRERENLFVYKLDLSKGGATRLSTSMHAERPLYYGSDVYEMDWEYTSSAIEGHVGVILPKTLIDAVFPYIVGPVGSPAHYLPADRAGVMHAHRVVVSALVERAASAGIRSASPVPMLSGVLADFLEQLIALDDLPRDRRRRSEHLASHLEKTLLGGAVHHEERAKLETPYSSFFYRPRGWKESLPMMRTSSMVSELAPVVLYLRHVVRKGDVLIIEEPESHLHPEMQVEFTRILATAVRSGIRVIMTTHSEWVLEELANLVQASALTKTQRKEINSSDIALNENEVGAWLFRPKKRPKGSVVEEIPLNRESGTFAAGYDKVAVNNYNRWAEMTSLTDKREGE